MQFESLICSFKLSKPYLQNLQENKMAKRLLQGQSEGLES